MKWFSAASFSLARGMRSEYLHFANSSEANDFQSCAYLLAEGHRVDPVSTYFLPTLAEMGS